MAKSKANLNYWREQLEVDYFTHFIKAFIYFNGWYRHEFGDKLSERDIIDALKNQSNVIRDAVLPLLGRAVDRRKAKDIEEQSAKESDDTKRLKQSIAELHRAIDNLEIKTDRGERITFERVWVAKNPLDKESFTQNHISYSVDVSNQKEIKVNVYNTKKKKVLLNIPKQPRYRFADLESEPDFKLLSAPQAIQLRSCYERLNPRLLVNLTEVNGHMVVKLGSYEFCDNVPYIFAGVIEVIYQLRCHLFHGSTLPSSKANGVYGAAYTVLRELIRHTE